MRKRLFRELIKFAVGLLLLIVIVELLAAASGLPHTIAILRGINTLWTSGKLAHDVQVSTARWLMGWAAGAAFGVTLGLLTGRSHTARLTLEGFLILCRAIPFISLLPLCVRLFGLEERGKLFLVAWASAGACWIIVHHSSGDVPPVLRWRATSLGLTKSTWIFRVLLPACSGGIHASLRASLSLGLIAVAVAEMSGVYERSSGLWWSEGLGYRLFRSLDESRDDLLLATILVFSLMGILGDCLFVLAWRQTSRAWLRFRQLRVARLMTLARRLPAGDPESWKPPVPVEATHIEAGYDGKLVVHDLSLHVPAGATLALVGPSGCGKTTLLRALGHFTDESFRTRGSLRVGEDFYQRAGPWVGIVFQDAPVFGHLTVWENLVLGSRFAQLSREETARVAWYFVSEFGLAPLACQLAANLSGGQRQRLALASTLANRPRLLLLDEPFGALDAITRRQLQEFYSEHIAGRVTAVFVTHDLNEAVRIGDVVRVGVHPDADSFEIDKHGVSAREWERTEQFTVIYNRVIDSLENAFHPERLE